MNHRVGQWIFGLGVGILVAYFAYQWISDPTRRAEHALQVSVITAARQALETSLAIGELETVDPLSPDRKVGKTYVYRTNGGWEISGYYRRGEGDRWHPFLMTLDEFNGLTYLKVRDADLVDRGRSESLLEVIP